MSFEFLDIVSKVAESSLKYFIFQHETKKMSEILQYSYSNDSQVAPTKTINKILLFSIS